MSPHTPNSGRPARRRPSGPRSNSPRAERARSNGSRGIAGGGSRGEGPRGGASGDFRSRPSRAVYRRRRIVVLLGGLVVLALLVWGGIAAVQGITATAKDAIAQNEAEAAASAAPEAPAEEEAAEPTPSETAVVAEGPCDEDDVTVAAATDKKTYAAGEKPKLALQVTNGTDAPCSIDVGTSQQEFVVLEGGEQIWSSADCQDVNADQERARDEVAFSPDETKESVLEWGVLRSTQGCTAVEEKVEPGDYSLQVYLGGKKSKAAKFTID